MFFGWSNVWACQKLYNWDFPRHYKGNICQTLHDASTHLASPVHYTFSDLDVIQVHSSVKKF